jgi:hypothetical protein
MKEDPEQPSKETAHAKATALQHGEILADDRHVTFVEVPKRPLGVASSEVIRDQPAHVPPLLDRDLRDPRQRPAIPQHGRGITDNKYCGPIRDIHEWSHGNAACTIGFCLQKF